jgi:hypothetical protein
MVVFITSEGIQEGTFRYDNQLSIGSQGTISYTVTEDMDAPVFVYYNLQEFYQNHRRYVKSKSNLQLRGKETTSSDISDCDPLEARNGKTLYPCGLVANSQFSDVFNLTVVRAGARTFMTQRNCQDWDIAWTTDREDKFKARAVDPATEIATKDINSEDFMIWMRVAALPSFRKLYRKISEFDLKKGDVLEFGIDNRFPVADFWGEKWIIVSTTAWTGGRQFFLAWVYFSVAGCAFIYACVLLALWFWVPRKLGDVRYWKDPALRTGCC